MKVQMTAFQSHPLYELEPGDVQDFPGKEGERLVELGAAVAAPAGAKSKYPRARISEAWSMPPEPDAAEGDVESDTGGDGATTSPDSAPTDSAPLAAVTGDTPQA